MPPPLRQAALQLRTAARVVRTRGGSPADAFRAPDERMVFVFGSPRSGTTFLAGAIGACPGFVDLGEVAPLKRAIPELQLLDPADAARQIRRLLDLTRRLSLVGARRAVEQTPECAFVGDAIALALPQASFVHIVRDGRDVVCSLLERGWLNASASGEDDAGLAYGGHARFWVEPGREREFGAASDARRAAWAWRRYVAAARSTPGPLLELRYEELAADPVRVADQLAGALGADRAALRTALGAVFDSSVGRYRRDLDREQLAEVEAEAGPELRALGYLQDR